MSQTNTPTLLQDYVLLTPLTKEEVKQGSLVLLAPTQEGPVRRAIVAAKGPGHFADGVFFENDGFEVGDTVLVPYQEVMAMMQGSQEMWITRGRSLIGVAPKS